MVAAETLLLRARKAASLGRYAEATRFLDRAHNGADDPLLEARVDITRAYVQAETGDPVGGIEQCTQILARDDLDPLTRGKAWQQLGLLRMRTGAADTALEALGEAITVLPAGVADRGYALLNRGNVHLQSGRAAAAAADFEAARAELDGAGLEVARAKAEHNLGYARLLTGDLVGAMRMIDEAAVVLAPVSAVNRATVEQDRAEILTAAGRPRDAIRSLETAAAAYGARRLRTFQAECELTLAWTLLRQDPPRARNVARRASRRFRGQASPARACHADAAALVAEIAAGGRAPSVLARADEVVASLRELGGDQDADQLELQAARVCVQRGELDAAARRLGRLRLRDDAAVPTRLLAREVRAELAAARGHSRRAHRHVREGLGELHAWQSSFGSLDLQSTLVGHGHDLARMGLELALDRGDPQTVFEWSERARALVGRVAPLRPPTDQQAAEDLAELRSLRDQDRPRAQELRQRVARRGWYAAGTGDVGEPASLDELSVALREDDAALVAPMVVRDRVAALVVTASHVEVADLGAFAPLRDRIDALTSDLTLAAAHRDDPLAAPLRVALRTRLASVAEQLVDPVAALLEDRRVVLTPSGGLAGTPWSLLPGLLGRPFTIPPSATRWLALRGTSAPARVGLVAGPGVARAEEELARAAAAWWGAEMVGGAEATCARVAPLASSVDLLHLSGHGRHTQENPLFSAVELYDGPWFGYDIDQLERTPDTVVLSACELGRVSVRSGEEAIGMSAAWLHAGARTVLSSPVLIADDIACDAMARWHGLVARGRTPADALAEVTATADDVVPMLSFGGGW